MIAKHAALTMSQSAYIRRREATMTFSKLLATTTLVGMMGTAAFANDINFTQSGGSITTVSFEQYGLANVISANGITAAAASTVTGSLDWLQLRQSGDSNAASFAITTDSASTGTARVDLNGDDNTSTLVVTQDVGDTLNYQVAMLGDDNSVDATISAFNSTVKIDSQGNNLAYTIEQSGDTANENVHSITANVSKTGIAAATIRLEQSGLSNTITMGTVGSFGAYMGTGGLTLNGAATVRIDQTSAAATYTAASVTIDAGGSLSVYQSAGGI